MSNTDKAVVLVSGGINSSVAAAVAREKYECALLHVSWGHRAAEQEREAFEHISSILTLDSFTEFGGSARVSKRLAIENASALRGDIPLTFTLGLMPTMLSMATAWAGALKAKRIIVGTSEHHGVPGPVISDLYPDYRHEFIQSMNLLLHYCKPKAMPLVVEAPLIEMNRAEVIKLGQRFHIPYERTWSCYEGNSTPCRLCLACATRAAGFVQSGQPDPLLPHAATAEV
jgi:7-cyano-7-deazaguanine synthase